MDDGWASSEYLLRIQCMTYNTFERTDVTDKQSGVGIMSICGIITGIMFTNTISICGTLSMALYLFVTLCPPMALYPPMAIYQFLARCCQMWLTAEGGADTTLSVTLLTFG